MDKIKRKDYIHLNQRYGLSVEQYEELLLKQNGVCAACGKPPRGGGKGNANRRLFVDHDHQTGDIRGLLCQGCNAAVGLVYEDPVALRRLAEYLEEDCAIPAADLKKRRKGLYQLSKTHCVNGHPYTPENTYIYPKTGHRLCRVCRAAADKTRQAYQAAKKREYRERDRALRKLRDHAVPVN